ncbi:hypothetical protein FG386_000401 [Cryptosporidium ryanae]|uniref:uncharacterized protein n=1 Tax=Cryptosporidium ryanae TaxID=515981 RepID=UPI00351A1213|nr:hypothetical protein FG386_000401 [Cryptosporidium ryanae]
MENEYDYPEDWKAFSKKIENETTNPKNGVYCVLLIGPKNSGKTTFLMENIRLVANSNPSSHIYVLDCDLGQPLISPPNCVKLVRWNRAKFRISERNINALPDLMFYVGGNSPINYPLRYIKIVRECIYHVQDLKGKNNISLFLNLPGWITGVGSEILSIITSLCIEVSDRVVVGFTKQVEDNKLIDDISLNMNKLFNVFQMKDRFDTDFSIRGFEKTDVFITQLSDLFINQEGNNEVSNNSNTLIYFDSYICYFSTELQRSSRVIHYPFNSICIVPSLNTTMNSYQLQYHIEYRLTNSVVGLCIFRDKDNRYIPDFSETGELNVLETDMFFPCIGFGVVHHINYKSKRIVIIAPDHIPSSNLLEINVIQLTEIMLPYNYSFYSSNPYICRKDTIIQGSYSGGKVPCSRKNVKRKIHNI